MSIPSVVSATVRRRRHSLLLGSADYTGSTLTASVFALTANGSSTTTLEATVYKNGVLASGETVEFTVERITLSAADSLVYASPTTIENDGTESATLSVQVLASDLRPLPGIPAASVVLASTGTGNTLTQPASATTQAGLATGSIVTTVAEAKTISATVCGLAITDTATVTATASAGPSLPAANKYIDGAEGGALDNNDPNGINVDGFAWTSSSGAPFTIVDDTQYQIAPTVVGPLTGRQWENAPDGTAGTNAFRARYAASSSAFAEQRFNFGADYPEFWMRYWIRVPINFSHTNVSGGSTNNKFLVFWQDGYSTGGQGGQGLWEYRPGGGNTTSSGTSTLYYKHKAGLNSDVFGGDTLGVTDFIQYPADRGRWMQIIVHMKVSSALDVADGEMHFYRRWEGDTSFTLLQSNTSLIYNVPPGYTGFRAGYFMGASNSWWTENTEWLVDDIEVSTTTLVPA